MELATRQTRSRRAGLARRWRRQECEKVISRMVEEKGFVDWPSATQRLGFPSVVLSTFDAGS